MKETKSEQLYCKKKKKEKRVSFSYNRDTITNITTTIYEKKKKSLADLFMLHMYK